MNILLWSLLKFAFFLSPCCCYRCAGWMNMICCLIHNAAIKGPVYIHNWTGRAKRGSGSLQDKEDSKLKQYELSSNLFSQVFLLFFLLRKGSGSLPLSLCASSFSVSTHTGWEAITQRDFSGTASKRRLIDWLSRTPVGHCGARWGFATVRGWPVGMMGIFSMWHYYCHSDQTKAS